jgi:hypothetical protein
VFHKGKLLERLSDITITEPIEPTPTEVAGNNPIHILTMTLMTKY